MSTLGFNEFLSSLSNYSILTANTNIVRRRRKQLAFYVRNYHLIIAAFVTLILLLATWSQLGAFIFAFLIPYWIYVSVVTIFKKRKSLYGERSDPATPRIQMARALLLWSGTVILLIILFWQTDYAMGSIDGNLWLFFLLAVFVMSHHSGTVSTVGIVILSCFVVLVLSLQFTTLPLEETVINASIKSSWLVLLSFMLYILLGAISDWETNSFLLNNVAKELVDAGKIDRERNPNSRQMIFDTAVTEISRKFVFPHVNIFWKVGDHAICLAAASEAGKLLIKGNYELPLDTGIVGHVLRQGSSLLVNDVEKDNRFYAHESFPETRAELTVPIFLKGITVGAVDIQAESKGFFLDLDKQIIETIASYISTVIENLELHEETESALEYNERLGNMIKSTTQRFLTKLEMMPTLRAIAEMALSETGADVVALYERDPETGSFIGPIVAGELLHEESLKGSPEAMGNTIHAIVEDNQRMYFHSELAARNTILEDLKSKFDPKRKPETWFINREEIKSRVIWTLRHDDEIVGIIFFNFRENIEFDDREKLFFYSFTDLASLAISEAQYHERRVQQQHQLLASTLHDQLKNSSEGARKLLKNAIIRQQNNELDPEDLEIVYDAIEDLSRDLWFLEATFRDNLLPDSELYTELRRLCARAQIAYNVIVDLNWSGNESVPHNMNHNLKMLATEGIYNALMHSKANKITVKVEHRQEELKLKIEDNGKGFNLELIDPNGLKNMKYRAEKQLNGSYQLQTDIGTGTCIEVRVPLD